MNNEINIRDAGSGVTVNAVHTERFKSSLITVTFAVPLARETVSANALVPYLLSRNCEKYPLMTQFNERLAELYGAAVSAGAEKLGDVQLLRLGVTFLNDRFALDGESISGECAQLLCDMIFSPVLESGIFTSENVEREKRLMAEVLDSEFNEKRIYALNRFEEVMFENEPYGVGRLGTKETVNAVTPQQVSDAWRNMLRTAPVFIDVIGEIDADRVFDIFSGQFGRIDRSATVSVTSEVKRTGRETPQRVEEKLDVAQSKLVMGLCVHEDDIAGNAHILAVMTDLFGGGPYSKLFMNVREKLSLCYYCSARFVRQKGIMAIQSGVETANIGAAETEIIRQLDTVKAGRFSDDELNASKLGLTDTLGTVNDSLFSIDAWYYRQLCNDTILTPGEYAEKINSVTPSQVVDAAGKVKLDTVYVLVGEQGVSDKGGEQ